MNRQIWMPRPSRDVALLFFTRFTRLFAYGFLSVVLALYLAQVGVSKQAIGLLFSLALAGDAGITLWITTSADRVGRRRMLVLGAALMVLAGVTFAATGNLVLLAIAAIVGVISPGGKEIGPFLAIEQASLSQLLPSERRTHAFGWYNFTGSFASALGALSGGWLAETLQRHGVSPLEAYRVVLIGYALGGGVLTLSFLSLSQAVETTLSHSSLKRPLGLHRSRRVILALSALFALDAFAGGFVVQSLVVYWLQLKFGIGAGALGEIFFGANILAGISALLASRIAARIGLINTMVFTHIPSNVLLCAVPLMPTLSSAVAVLLLRFSISQMDVPTRQSFTMAVVSPDERSAASGVTSIARSVGASLSPAISGLFLASPALIGMPFLVAGGLKILYDLALYFRFRSLKPPEERYRVN